MCRFQTTDRPRLRSGSGSRRGVVAHRYGRTRVQVPAVPDVRAGGAPAAAVRARPVRVEPGAGAALDVASLAGPDTRVQRAGGPVDPGPRRESLAGCGLSNGPAASIAGPGSGVAQLLRRHPPAPDLA